MAVYEGFLDRIEDNTFAVIIVEELGREFVLKTTELPPRLKEGTRLRVSVKDNALSKVEVNEQSTAAAHERIKQKKAALLQNKKTSAFKRK